MQFVQFVAPQRGGSLQRFVEKARSFKVSESGVSVVTVVDVTSDFGPLLSERLDAMRAQAGFRDDTCVPCAIRLRFVTT